jgi:hypothetical protein
VIGSHAQPASQVYATRFLLLPTDRTGGVAIDRRGEKRPVLMSCGERYTPLDTDTLWISREGTPISEEALRKAFKRRTEEAFGVAIPPHRFRDASATDVADKDPTNVMAGALVLGNHPTTLMRYYNMSTGRAAHERYHDAIAEIRATRRGPKREEE